MAFESGFLLNFFLFLSLVLFLTFLAERASRSPPSRVAPTVASQGGGGGRRALRWRWAWPAARAGGAVARRPPSSLAAGGALCAGRQAGSRSPRGPQGAVDGARAAIATPDPKAGSLGWAQRGGGALLSIFCLRPKTVGCGRLPGCTGSVPDALQPAGFFSFDLGLDGLVFQAPADLLLCPLDYWG